MQNRACAGTCHGLFVFFRITPSRGIFCFNPFFNPKTPYCKPSMKKIITAFTVFASLAFATAVAQYNPIPQQGLSAFASSNYNGAPPGKALDLTPGNGLDGAGLLDNEYTHMWVTGTEEQPWFYVDLGENYNLAAIKLWNYNQSGWLDRGIRVVDIRVAPDGAFPGVAGAFPFFDVSDGWTHVVNHDFDSPRPDGINGLAACPLLEFSAVRARWVAFNIYSTWAGNSFGDLTGIGKLQFFSMDRVLEVRGEPGNHGVPSPGYGARPEINPGTFSPRP